jgi:hypothetical protein
MSLVFREISFVLAKSIWAAMQDILRTCLPQENPMWPSVESWKRVITRDGVNVMKTCNFLSTLSALNATHTVCNRFSICYHQLRPVACHPFAADRVSVHEPVILRLLHEWVWCYGVLWQKMPIYWYQRYAPYPQ